MFRQLSATRFRGVDVIGMKNFVPIELLFPIVTIVLASSEVFLYFSAEIDRENLTNSGFLASV
jgi:hypothetical protein